MSRRIKKSKKIILYVIFACVCMTLLDLFVKPIYTIKCLIKIILFFVIPLFILTKRDRKSLIRMIKPKKELNMVLNVTNTRVSHPGHSMPAPIPRSMAMIMRGSSPILIFMDLIYEC